MEAGDTLSPQRSFRKGFALNNDISSNFRVSIVLHVV